MRSQKFWCLVVLVICSTTMSLLVGCGSVPDGPPRARIFGKITLDGQPVGGGEIRFVPTKGAETVSRITPDGAYDIDVLADGPVVGKNKVTIEWYRDTGRKDDEGHMIPEQAIPAKYNSETTLSVEIKLGKNEQPFELLSK